MRSGAFSTSVLAVALLSGFPAHAASGRVTDAAGRPLPGARACLWQEGEELLCTETDDRGAYQLPSATDVPAVRITLEGYLPVRVAAVDQEAPVALARAASFHARLVDAASGAPLEGELTLADPSGRKHGPFPVGRGGLRVKTIEPGRFVPTGRAPGHADAVGEAVDLVPGAAAEIVLRLAAEPAR